MTQRPARRSRKDGERNTVGPRIDEPRIEQMDGRPVLTFERKPVIQPTLERLLSALNVTYSAEVRPGGASSVCTERDHRLIRFREGRHVGLDGVVRDLRLLMCADCETVCVRDITVDRLPGLRSGRLMPRRRNLILGWYTGARPRQRVYL